MRESEKFDRCLAFGELLPLIRKRVLEDLEGDAPTRTRTLAAVVRLLDMGFIRIGNQAYAKKNKSFGASTLRDRHARIDGSKVSISFIGKGGKQRDLTLDDELLARGGRCARRPGYHLFQYVDPDGSRHEIGSSEVNAYLRETMGEEFSAKNFRTWHAACSLSRGWQTRRSGRPSRCCWMKSRAVWAIRPRSPARATSTLR